MKKRLTALASVAGAVAILAAPGSAMAAPCSDDTSQERHPADHPTQPNQPTGSDTIATLPGTGTTIYGDGIDQGTAPTTWLNPGYLGATGSTGYIEVSGHRDDRPDVQVDGKDSGGRLDGRISVDTGNTSKPVDVCVNGTNPS